MLHFLGYVLQGAVAILLLFAGALFPWTLAGLRRPKPGEPHRETLRRILIAYQANLQAVLSSAFFWAIAGFITALWLFFSWQGARIATP
jgi:hypothetical protein